MFGQLGQTRAWLGGLEGAWGESGGSAAASSPRSCSRGPVVLAEGALGAAGSAGWRADAPSAPRPLHIAARNGLASVVQALLSRGATVLAVDEEGACSSRVPGAQGLPGEALSRGWRGFPVPVLASWCG